MNQEKPIKQVLNELLASYNLQDKADETRLRAEWEKIAGGVIARRTEKLSVFNHTLHIWLNSAPLKQEIMFHKEVIIERINNELGSRFIHDLIVK